VTVVEGMPLAVAGGRGLAGRLVASERGRVVARSEGGGRCVRRGRHRAPRSVEISETATQSNVVRALTAQIAELKQRHRAETEHLQAALAAAQGENLALRRQLGRQGRTAGLRAAYV
jgi:hypothetical protein